MKQSELIENMDYPTVELIEFEHHPDYIRIDISKNDEWYIYQESYDEGGPQLAKDKCGNEDGHVHIIIAFYRLDPVDLKEHVDILGLGLGIHEFTQGFLADLYGLFLRNLPLIKGFYSRVVNLGKDGMHYKNRQKQSQAYHNLVRRGRLGSYGLSEKMKHHNNPCK